MEVFLLPVISKFNFCKPKSQILFGSGNLIVIDFHHQIRFGIWKNMIQIWHFQ